MIPIEIYVNNKIVVRKSNQTHKYNFNEPSNNYNEISSGYQNGDQNCLNIKDEKEAFFARKQYENMTRPE